MKFIPNAVSSKIAMTALKLSKSSPKLLFVGGVIGVGATVVMASRATLKVEPILNDAKKDLATFDEVVQLHNTEYTDEDRIKDKALVYVHTGIKLAKLYAPAAAVGIASISMLAGSHNILTRRNAALTAAYAAIDKGFREYRDRVIEDLGEESDKKYYHGVKTEKFDLVDEEGKKIRMEKSVATARSPYGVLFHEGNPNWTRLPEYNYLFLRAQQNYLNQRLQTKGFVLLNDALDALGFDRTPAGCVVGWLKDGNGDGYIDFGIFDAEDAGRIHEYMVGVEGELFVDFNVDGVVYEQI